MTGRKARTSQRHGGHGFDRKPHKPAIDFTTFFFSNFPNGYGEPDTFKVFQKWGRVKEVFISRRLTKQMGEKIRLCEIL